MRIIILLFTLSLLQAFPVLGQGDSVAFTIDMRMSDGVFVSYTDFRRNKPVLKEDITSGLDKEQSNFLEKALRKGDLTYTQGGSSHTVPTRQVWGFFQNGTFYINLDGVFYRVPVFGAISYFTGQVTSTDIYLSPYANASSFTARQYPEYLLYFYDGYVIAAGPENLRGLLVHDTQLFNEYNALSRRKRKAEMHKFIRRYNERNPIYFLK